jgi:hypothetical protein
MKKIDYFALIQEGLKKLSPDLIEKYVEVESEYRAATKVKNFVKPDVEK